MSRLPHGGLIDRSRPLNFRFDGETFAGFEGDTLASALLANDVKLVGRSFKYHRPRGILTAGSEEPNALVTLRSGARAEPNTRATMVQLFEGLEAQSQNRWPNLKLDLMAVNQLAGPMFAAGFYYKTFMWPRPFWEKVYEPVIRRAAGLGELSGLPDPDTYDHDHAFCDLLVIGAGPAGLSAALTVGRAGLRVILAEDDWELGGRLLADRQQVDGLAGEIWAERARQELSSLPNVKVLTRTAVFGIYDGREYAAIERLADHLPSPAEGQPRQRLWKIVAKRAILATGAIERPIVFGGNDRPGVMQAGAVRTYVNRFAAMPGRRAVLFTSSDSGWQTALDLQAVGIEVAVVVDPRSSAPTVASDVQRAGAQVFLDAHVRKASGVPVSKVEIMRSDGRVVKLSADLVAISGGWNPAIGLGSNLGHRPKWCDERGCFLLDQTPPGLTAAGAAAGRFTLAEALADGAAKAVEAASDLGTTCTAPDFAVSEESDAGAAYWSAPAPRGKAFVDFQNDVTDKDVALAAREGFVSIEHMKRYTTLGMATDQGKSGQLNGHALLAQQIGKSIAETGTILSRAPYQPVAIGALAGHQRGENFRPVRQTASHDWAAENGAAFANVGQWKRAQWYARQGETHWRESVDREVTMTRSGVGICDVSTLGKIDVQGPDAGVLLDRLYINTFSTLNVGKARYGVMLREDGMVMDDGTVTHFAEDSFYVTTTTANAAPVMQHIDFARQVLWPDLDVQATSVTEQWATWSVAGPKSRELLQAAFPDLDLSNDSFPFMAAAKFVWQGNPARIFRVSFSGELAFEVSVPALKGQDLLAHLLASGEPFDAIPYGTEALGVMRIEKGHPAGNELNGQTTAADLGLARMMSKKKDYIGRVMAARPGLVDEARPRLVGLRPLDASEVLRAGAHLLPLGAAPVAVNDQGYVTSAAWSPTLGHSIALALLSHGAERHGETVLVHDPVRGGDIEAAVCDPVFLDPEGERMRG
ncbi:MAG: sarcosine oxidase subunit alpha family protein [Novosphingobium sp.]|nr:sarcosine oxidase subunit alpha family protein [Novosphingobium sp.]